MFKKKDHLERRVPQTRHFLLGHLVLAEGGVQKVFNEKEVFIKCTRWRRHYQLSFIHAFIQYFTDIQLILSLFCDFSNVWWTLICSENQRWYANRLEPKQRKIWIFAVNVWMQQWGFHRLIKDKMEVQMKSTNLRY